MSSGGGAPPAADRLDRSLPDEPTNRSRLVESSSAFVALGATVAVVAIAWLAIGTLPAGQAKSANIVTLATAAFGVLGALAGSYFAVRAADRGINKVAAQSAQRESNTERRRPDDTSNQDLGRG